MTFDVTEPALAAGAALGVGFLSGIVPTGAAELAAIGIGVLKPVTVAALLLVSFTVGHVAAKVPWYFVGTHADRVFGARVARYVERARGLLRAHPRYGTGLLFVSALASVPPFHLASIAAGITGIPVVRFVLICFVGRLCRFGLLAAIAAAATGSLPPAPP